MDLDIILCRRIAKLNLAHKPAIHIKSMNETLSGGLNFTAIFDFKNGSRKQKFFIPKIMRHDLEHENPNQSLDNKFRL